MKTLNWGDMPTQEEFADAFDKECPNGIFCVRNDPVYGNRDFKTFELYKAIKSVAEDQELAFTDDHADFVTSVMQVLGFEWM